MPRRLDFTCLIVAAVVACAVGGAVVALTSSLEPRYRAIHPIDVQASPELVRVASLAVGELPGASRIQRALAIVLDRNARFPTAAEWRRARHAALDRTPGAVDAVLHLRRFHPVENPPNDDDLRVIADANSAFAARRLSESAATRVVSGRIRRVRRILITARNELRVRARLAPDTSSARLTSRARLVDTTMSGRVSNLALGPATDVSMERISPSVVRDGAVAAILGAVLGAWAAALVRRRRDEVGR